MECDRPQALLDEAGLHFAAERIGLGQVEEWLGLHLAVRRHDLHAADALDHENAPRAIIGDGDADRIVEPVGDLDQRDLRIAGNLAARTGDLCG